MKANLSKIKEATETKDINWCLKKNYNSLSIDWHLILEKWLCNSYSVFKDHEKYLILILLVKRTFDYYTTNFVQLNWNQFFALKKIEIVKFSIIDISKELHLSKETTRRKIEELEKINIIKKTKNGIIVQPEFYNNTFIKKHEDFRKSICIFISKFSMILTEEKIIKEKIKSEMIEKVTYQNFSYVWKVFFEMLIPMMVDFRYSFKDLETWHIWETCLVNRNYEIQKYLKINNLKVNTNKEFLKINSKTLNTVGINAMSISNITGIPRGTVFRKLQILVKKNFLYIDEKKLYNPNIEIDRKNNFYKLDSDNVVRLSVFINKLLNLANVFK